ncbi:MAG: UvrD-helicase domain-containing protein [Clostridia bacterium]|nr:UvrD-helicase domain-containing protein [Clostridia bacterium]
MSFVGEKAKYSVLIATEEIEEKAIEKMLLTGLKVIVFCSENREKTLRNFFREFSDAGFLSVYKNQNHIEVVYVDGKNLDEEVLATLEKGDTRFNLEQYLVEHEDKSRNLIVEAGAGTGKTHVMIDRIMYLMHMDSGFSFSRVAMITFTNKATDNMRHRLVNTLEKKYKLTGNVKYLDRIEELSQISISTIHSFFKKVIVEVGAALGYGTNLQLKSHVQERKELLRDILNEQYKGKCQVQKVIGLPVNSIEKLAFEFWKRIDNNGLTDDELRNLDWGDTSSPLADLIQNSLKGIFQTVNQRYDHIKFKTNSISMQDIIHELGRIIEKTDVRDYISIKYEYMFCDEFQDSDNVQIQTIAELNRFYGGHLFVVGDIKQSIYRFRGASDSAFRKLTECLTADESQQLIVRSLKKNYRTSGNVLNKLDSIFKRWNAGDVRLLRYGAEDILVPQNNHRGNYVQIPVNKRNREQKVVDTIKRIQSKSPNTRITCLTRTNAQLRLIKEWCEKEKIVCLIKERGTFYSSRAVLDFCALLEACLYDKEPMYLYNFIMSPYGSGSVPYDELEDANGNRLRILKALWNQLDLSKWTEYRKDFTYKPVLSVLREIVTSLNPVEVYGSRRVSVLIDMGYGKNIAKEQALIDTLQYEANLKKLLQILSDQFSGDFSTLADLCKFLRLKILTDHDEELADIELERQTSFVEGFTVHGAKGLEFENVLIPFMNAPFTNRFRSEILISEDKKRVGWIYRNNGDEISNEQYGELVVEDNAEVAREETRLLYVAMTRTINGLYCFPDTGHGNGWTIKSWADLLPEEMNYA